MLGRAAGRYAATVVMILSAVVGAPATAAAQEGGFSDVAEGAHKPAIDALADRGVFEGTLCGREKFCPGEPISRSDMAVWLIRALGDDAVPAAGTTRFVDVDVNEWWAPYVERLADLGITAGCRLDPLRFCAGDPVRRSHMATFLAQALGLLEGPSAVATDASGRRMVAFGLDHTCWLMPDGNMQCWSIPDGDELDTPEGPFIAITAGDGFTCGMRLQPGAILCWGDTIEGPLRVPNGRFNSLAAGYDHVCAVRTDTAIVCWGASEAGQTDPLEGEFQVVVSGAAYSCGLGLDGAVRCWGDNRFGQTDAPEGSFVNIAAGPAHGCAIRADGAAVCWGDSRFGQADPPTGDFTQVAAGLAHSCALGADGSVQCWGNNALGQTDAPEGNFTAIWAGLVQTCALDTDNNVLCWGAAA